MFIIARYLKEVRLFFSDLYKSRRLIVDLAQREFRIKYSENYLGLAWAVLEPVAMMLILLVVFTYLRNRSHSSYPFVAYLLSGVVPFTFFSSSLSQATTSIKSFSFLLKQGSIRAGLLPLVNILSALKTHLIILCVAIGIFLGVGIRPSWYWLQLPYFTISSIILLVGLTWITSSLVLFVRDIQ
nr:ABC transporter permease [Bacteroidota bacterium]